MIQTQTTNENSIAEGFVSLSTVPDSLALFTRRSLRETLQWRRLSIRAIALTLDLIAAAPKIREPRDSGTPVVYHKMRPFGLFQHEFCQRQCVGAIECRVDRHGGRYGQALATSRVVQAERQAVGTSRRVGGNLERQ
jgi:hypothetical protein